jgi:ABC-type sugar transport system substrate-binding protein
MFPRPGRILACFLIVLAACSPRKQPKIGVSVATMQEAVYSFMRKAMLEKSSADGVELVWVSAENSESKQRADVEGLIAQGVDVLVLHAVNTATAGELVKKAAAAGIPVVAMDRLPSGVAVRLYVTANSRLVGRLQAQYLAQALGGKGNVVLLEGETGNSTARDITAGNLEILAGYPDIKLVLRRAHKNWARDLAKTTVDEAFAASKDGVQGILANNSGMAMGALEAVEGRLSKADAATVVVIGADADRDACEAIIEGRLAADIDKMPTEIARATYDAAQKLIRRERLTADAVVDNAGIGTDVRLTPVKLITKDNVKPAMEYRWGDL